MNGNVDSFFKEWGPRKEVEGKQTEDKHGPCLLLVSSTSGFGNAVRLTPTVVEKLAEYFTSVVVVPTQRSGHAREIMRTEENLSRYEIVVVLGGDGAFSEAANGRFSMPALFMPGLPKQAGLLKEAFLFCPA